MELINKAALMARIQSEGKHQASQIANRYDPVVLAFGDCYAMAKTAPTIDAVEVVRCKDCKLRHSSEFCECRDENAFCSDGEHRESEGT